MKAEDFKGLTVTGQYGEMVTISDIVGNTAHTYGGITRMYHTTKIFYEGKSVFEHLNEGI
jgi:hypothetical protein